MNEQLLTQVEELEPMAKAGDLFLIDTREPQVYQKGHIPGAVNMHDFFLYISLRENGDLPALVEHFTQLLRDAGLQKEHKVVLYEDALDNGYGRSCRGWVLMQYFGHPWVSVLNGGYRAWKAKNMPVTTDVPIFEPSNYKPELAPNVIVTTEQMLAAMDDPDIQILDNRDYAEWVGANSSPYGYDYCPRKGRIPGAVWVEWYRLMTVKEGVPWFKCVEEIRAIVSEIGLDRKKTVYIYCFKGARAANSLMALKLAGYHDVRNYFNSWNEWSRDFDLPIEEGYPEHNP